MTFYNIITSLQGILIVFLIWFIKVKIKDADSRRIEKLKNSLQLESKAYQQHYDLEIEKFKSKLNDLNVKLSSLHTERLGIIKELYQKLVRLNSAMYILTMPMKPIYDNFEEEEKARIDEAQKQYQDFNNYINFNKIYFSPDLAETLEEARKLYFSANWDHLTPNRYESMGLSKAEAMKDARQNVQNASKIVREQIPKLLEKIELEFRTILGVISTN